MDIAAAEGVWVGWKVGLERRLGVEEEVEEISWWRWKWMQAAVAVELSELEAVSSS